MVWKYRRHVLQPVHHGIGGDLTQDLRSIRDENERIGQQQWQSQPERLAGHDQRIAREIFRPQRFEAMDRETIGRKQ